MLDLGVGFYWLVTSPDEEPPQRADYRAMSMSIVNAHQFGREFIIAA